MKGIALVLIIPGFLSLTTCGNIEESQPNILLIMVDDLGFSDFGCYGSEIQTPHIDKLATNGLRFTQFYNTAKCHSSRVSLLSGLYPTEAGDESLSRATTIAEVVGQRGYFTSMTGKWHLFREPTDVGFDRYWGHLSGSTDYFKGDSTFRLNGEQWDAFGKDFYTTDANVDYSFQFIDEALENHQPFFHYIAFNAPHYPLQAHREDIEKYQGVYDKGWDKIREGRFEKQKILGLFPDSMVLPRLPDHMTKWETLGKGKQEFESFRMSVYAAMVDCLDQNIGRLAGYLEEKGVMDNTLIMICSDNGACPFERSRNLNVPPWEGGSYYLYDASWATVCNTPLKHYKQTQHEGGISSPLIVHWPGHIKNPGGLEDGVGHLIDIMATCIEVTSASYPEDENIQPLQGTSLVPLFEGEGRAPHEALYFRFRNCRALRKGDWKLVSFYGSRWELYNVVNDRTEQVDLAQQYPAMVDELSGLWYQMAEKTDLLPEKDRSPVNDVPAPNTHREWHRPELVENWSPVH